MDPILSRISIIDGPIPVVMLAVAALCVVLLVARPMGGRSRGRWAIVLAASAVVGAAVGLLVCWLVGDVANAFDVTLSATTRAWVAASFAGVGVAIANLPRSGVVRRIGTAFAIVPILAAGVFGVNADFGQYTTLGSITGDNGFASPPADALATQLAIATGSSRPTVTPADWVAPAGMPRHGIVGSVTIPATQSHFAARAALIYLPPAALVANPPVLPVLVMLSGQPGSPANVFDAGHLDGVLNDMAVANRGLAPIVVVPDQLSADDVNPMCVDSAIGNSATYLTVDVPNWIRANLGVAAAPSGWAIGGWSQGGTCAIQLGAGHPEIFGSLLDISGELEPKHGSLANTIDSGFAGDAAAYDAAKPLAILARGAPYTNTVAVFGVGSADDRYLPRMQTVSAAAAAAGMHTSTLISPGTDHDWATVRYSFVHGFPAILQRMGLTAAAR